MAKKKDLSEKVMKQIQQGRVKMKPRLYFVIGSLLLGIGLAGVLALAVFFTHLVFFHLRTHVPFAFLRLGVFGLRGFLVNFPWLPLFISLAGLAGGSLLLRQYDFSYKRNFWGLLLGLVGLILATGFLIDRARPERPLGQMRPIQSLYQGQFRGEDWVVGEIEAIKDNELKIKTPEGKEVTIVWDEKTRLPLGRDFQEADLVRAVGEWQDGTLEAKGILYEEAFQRIKPFSQEGMGPGEVKGRFHPR